MPTTYCRMDRRSYTTEWWRRALRQLGTWTPRHFPPLHSYPSASAPCLLRWPIMGQLKFRGTYTIHYPNTTSDTLYSYCQCARKGTCAHVMISGPRGGTVKKLLKAYIRTYKWHDDDWWYVILTFNVNLNGLSDGVDVIASHALIRAFVIKIYRIEHERRSALEDLVAGRQLVASRALPPNAGRRAKEQWLHHAPN